MQAVPEFEQAYKDLHSDAMRQEIGTDFSLGGLGLALFFCRKKSSPLNFKFVSLICLMLMLYPILLLFLVIQKLDTENTSLSPSSKGLCFCFPQVHRHEGWELTIHGEGSDTYRMVKQ